MSGQFIGYHIDGFDCEKTVPVATGTTRYEALSKAVRRVLGSCIVDGQIGVQEKPDLSPEDFREVGRIADKFFADRGLE